MEPVLILCENKLAFIWRSALTFTYQ